MTIAPVSGTSTDLLNTNVSGAYISTISSDLTAAQIANLSSAAYGISIDNGANYKPVTSGAIVKTTSSATNATTGSFNMTLGVNSLDSTPAGTYSKTFVLSTTANPVSYAVTYNSNAGSDTVTNMPTSPQTTGMVTGTSLTLASETPVRAGYAFLGWSTNSSATTATYSAGGSYTLDETTSNTITLYAVWQVQNYTCTKRYRLQNADGTFPDSYTADTSESVAYGSTCTYSKTVTDYRGSSSAANGAAGSTSGTMTENGLTLSLDFYRNTYTLTINRNTTYISSVSGGGSGKLWGASVSISATLASNSQFNGWSQTAGTTGSFASTSNASTTFTMPKSNATIYADGKSAKTYLQNWTGCSSLAVGSSVTLYDNRDDQAYTVTKYNMGNNTAKCWMSNLNLGATQLTVNLTSSNTNISSTITASTFNSWIKSSGTGSYTSPELIPVSGQDSYGNKYGTLYNYAAASAGTYTYEEGSGTGNATSDLCPAGWRLPTGGSSGEFQAFYNANSPTGTTMQSGYGFSLAGRFSSSTPARQGSRGYYWSSTRYTGNYMYYLYFDSSSVFPADYSRRNYGYSVRCIKE